VTYRRILDWVIGFIDHLQVATTNNYNAISNLHTSQITRAHAMFSPACSIFTRRLLITASNNDYCSSSVTKSSLKGGSLQTASFLHRLPQRTNSVAQIVFLITPLHGPSRKHRFKQYLYCYMRIRCPGNMST
jgi:hypothetical protein